jgi:hypothetical protein
METCSLRCSGVDGELRELRLEAAGVWYQGEHQVRPKMLRCHRCGYGVDCGLVSRGGESAGIVASIIRSWREAR